MYTVRFPVLVFLYTAWHYGRALTDYARVIKNLFGFLVRLFSIPLLLRTLVLPFKRLDEAYAGGADLGGFAETLLVNVLMRAVGFAVRMSAVLFGIVALSFFGVLSLVAFVAWLLLPALVIASVAVGLVFLFDGGF